MSFLDIKARARRTIHVAFAVPCVYTNTDGSFNVTARLHDKIAVGGDITGQGYAGIIEGVTRAILNRELLATAGLAGAPILPARGDQLTFPDYQGTGQDVIVILDARDPYDGPVDEKWSVGPP